MVLKPDQQRVCMMLKETITLLCKNGLAFKNKFCIDAVIGVTLDDEDMFHISVNEIVKSGSEPDLSSSASESGEVSRKRRRKNKSKSTEVKQNQSDGSEGLSEFGNDESEQEDVSGLAQPAKEGDVKGEQSEEEKQDIIFVKQELGVDWSQSQEGIPDISQIQDSANLPSLPDMSLAAVGTTNNYNMWTSSALLSPNQYSQQTAATITTAVTNMVSAAGQNEGTATGSEQRLTPTSIKRRGHFQCRECNKSFKYKGSYLCHTAVHRGIYRYVCQYCGKGCTSNAVLKGHISKHTGIKEFKCHLCDYEFAYGIDLKRHLKRRHGISDQTVLKD